jgi:hypothetical protein
MVCVSANPGGSEANLKLVPAAGMKPVGTPYVYSDGGWHWRWRWCWDVVGGIEM